MTRGSRLSGDDSENMSALARRASVTRPTGLEPATGGLEIRCSVHLSYGRQLFYEHLRHCATVASACWSLYGHCCCAGLEMPKPGGIISGGLGNRTMPRRRLDLLAWRHATVGRWKGRKRRSPFYIDWYEGAQRFRISYPGSEIALRAGAAKEAQLNSWVHEPKLRPGRNSSPNTACTRRAPGTPSTTVQCWRPGGPGVGSCWARRTASSTPRRSTASASDSTPGCEKPSSRWTQRQLTHPCCFHPLRQKCFHHLIEGTGRTSPAMFREMSRI
jgi:hypothetical protein